MYLIVSRLRFTHSNDHYFVESQDKDEATAHKKKQALELLKYPYKFCDINKKDVIVANGKYGVYLKYDGRNINIGELKESELTRKNIKDLINKGSSASNSGSNSESSTQVGGGGIDLGENIIVKSGKFGAYIQNNGKNVSLKYSKFFKGLNKSHENLTLEECKSIIKEYDDYKSKNKGTAKASYKPKPKK